VLNAARNVLIQGDEFWSQDRPFETVYVAMMLSGLATRNERWHAALAVLGLVGFVTMILLVSLQPG
jgi:hypothetical protein